MKIKYIALSALMFGMSSCKDFLTTEPTDFLNPGAYYKTKEHIEFSRAGVYDILGSGGLYGTNAQYLLGWDGDAAYMNRASLTAGPWNYFYSTADPYSTNTWNALWQGVNRANVLLANLDKNPEIDQEYRDVVRGEIHFLRGYYYFLLVQNYGGVPIKIQPTASVEDVNQARNTDKEVYAQILSDMEKAETLVPDITTLGFGGAVSKSAVRGLLARVNLNMAGFPLKDESRYAEAKKWAKMVIDDTKANHAMNPNYPKIFMNLAGDVYDIKESIFEVEFFGNGLDNYSETGNQGWINGPASAATSATGRADSYMSITAKLYNIFEPGDARKFWNVAHFTYVTTSSINGAKTVSALPTTELAKYNLRPGKWRREYETVQPKSPQRTPQNVPILRFTDVLLMYAEAENALNGPTPEVVEIVNAIRWRGWSKGVKSITVTNGGTGYTTAPDVLISAGSGSNAEATSIQVAGAVTAVNLKRDATGVNFNQEGVYTSVPTVTIQGGGGTGATAVATIYTAEDAKLTAAQTATKASFHQVLMDERMRELTGEALRKSDLIRWGTFLQVCQDMGNTTQQDSPGAFFVRYYTNVSSRDLLMPIPAAEMTVNTSMDQNKGW